MDFYSQTLYTAESLSDLRLRTPSQLDAALGMEAYTIRRRKDGSPMPLTRQTERAMACAALGTILGRDVLEHVEFTSDRPSGPSGDLWKPPTYIVRIPSGGPDPLMPVPAKRIVAAILAACRDALAAYRYISGSTPFPADRFTDEADAIRAVRNMAANTMSESKMPNLGLGKDFDLDGAILEHEKARFASGIFDPVRSFQEDTLESCLVTLDTAASIMDGNKPVTVSFPATKPDPAFLEGKETIEQQDLPAIAAHLCAYAVPAPRSVACSMGSPVRLYGEGNVRDVMCGFPPMARAASDAELAEAAVLPFLSAASVLAGDAVDGKLPAPDAVPLEEVGCLEAIRDDPDPRRVRRTVKFLAGLHALAASMEDPWAVKAGIYDRILPFVTDGTDFGEWIASELDAAVSPLPEEPDAEAVLTAAYARASKAASYAHGQAKADWTPLSAKAFPVDPCVRYCDLPGLADAVARDVLSSSPAGHIVKSILVARNAPISGATPTKNRQGISLIVTVGETGPDGSRDPSEDAGRALDPAPDAAILQAVIAACQAVRRAEQTAAWSGAIPADERIGHAMGEQDPQARDAKLGLDAEAEAFRKAGQTFVASDAFRETYGFDLGAAMAAWRNLAAGAHADKSIDPGSAAELLGKLSSML